jgi:hypothetical protein
MVPAEEDLTQRRTETKEGAINFSYFFVILGVFA